MHLFRIHIPSKTPSGRLLGLPQDSPFPFDRAPRSPCGPGSRSRHTSHTLTPPPRIHLSLFTLAPARLRSPPWLIARSGAPCFRLRPDLPISACTLDVLPRPHRAARRPSKPPRCVRGCRAKVGGTCTCWWRRSWTSPGSAFSFRRLGLLFLFSFLIHFLGCFLGCLWLHRFLIGVFGPFFALFIRAIDSEDCN